MKGLISNKSMRILNILDFILMERKPIFVSDVMHINQCSKKTAYNDLDEIRIKFDLNLYNYDYDDPSNHLNVFQFMKMKNSILRNETSVKLLLELYSNPNQDILNLSISIDKSESHTRNLLLKLKKFLSQHHIELDKNDKGLYNLKSENILSLALFFSEFFKIITYDIFIAGGYPVYKLDHFKDLSYFDKEMMLLNLVVEQFSNFNNRECSKTSDHFIQSLKTDLYFHFNKEKSKLYLFLNNNNIMLKDREKEIVREIFLMIYIKQILQPIALNTHLNRYDYFYVDAQREKEEVVKLFEEFYSLIVAAGIELDSYKSELFFHLYTNLDFYKRVKQKKIGVFSDMGQSHIDSLCSEIEMNFKPYEVSEYNSLMHYDVIVTTCEIKDKNDCIPIIYIDDFLSPLDIQKMFIVLNKLN